MLMKTSREESEYARAQSLARQLEQQEKELLQDLKSAMVEQRDAFASLQAVLKKR